MRTSIISSPECCPDEITDPNRYICFYPDIIREYCKLRKRFFKTVTKRKRIWELAEPRTCVAKYRTPCLCMERFNRKVDIVRSEEPIYTRTEQLSYPPASRLLRLKDEWAYQNRFTNERRNTINRLIRCSLLSMYSRLANAQPPEEPEKPKSFTKEEFEVYKKRLNIISKPKSSKPKKKKPHPKVDRRQIQEKFTFKGGDAGADDVAIKRKFNRLSRPVRRLIEEREPWHFTEKMRTYEPSKRIKELSRPRFYSNHMINTEPYVVKKEALRYKATPRILNLAIPSTFSTKRESRDNPYKISENALYGRVSPRMAELAKPREYYDMHTREDPFTVSRRALKAKLTKRLIELSQPRKYD